MKITAPAYRLSARRCLSARLLFFAFSLIAATGPAFGAAKGFNVPAGFAETTLRQIAEQADEQFIFSADKVTGTRTTAIKGTFTTREAIERALAGTDLVVIQDSPTSALTVTRRPWVAQAARSASGAVRTAAAAPNSGAPRPAPSSANPPNESGSETVTLPAFTVSTESPSKYAPRDAISSSRVRADLLETHASISVATSVMFEETGATRILDTLRYLPGISEANSPNISDRATLRGFAANSGHFVDGAPNLTSANFDPVMIERVEVVSGPNSILAANGLAGGTVNIITKSPQYKSLRTLSAGLGRFFSNRVDLDMTGPLGERTGLAYRVIGSYQDADKVTYGTNLRQTVLSPALTYKRGSLVLTYKGIYLDWKQTYEGSLPVDPASGTLVKAAPLRSLPFRTFLSPELYRAEKSKTHNLLATAEINSHIAARLYLQYQDQNYGDDSIAIASAAAGGAVNPMTGDFIPGATFGPAPAYALLPTPAPQPNWASVAMSGTLNANHRFTTVVQNDYVATFDLPMGVSSMTTVGGQIIGTKQRAFRRAIAVTGINLFNPVFPPLNPTPNANTTDDSKSLSGYVLQRFGVLRDRLTVDGGVQATANRRRANNQATSVAAWERGNTTTFLGGVLFRITPTLSAYGSYSESGLPIATGIPLAPRVNQFGKQLEAGLKAELFNRRLRLTAATYDITFTNFRVSNPAAITNPNIPSSIFQDVKSYGHEIAIAGQLTRNIDIVANYSYNHLRDPLGRRQRGTADNQGAALLSYAWTTGLLSGASVNIGASYLGSRAGDTQAGLTAIGVPVQPSFYLPPRTLVNLGAAVQFGRYKVRANIDNVFDEKYIFGSSRLISYPGTPLNYSLRVTTRF
jgi:iron complex outermembrane receptor protein